MERNVNLSSYESILPKRTDRPILMLPSKVETRKRFSRIYGTDSNDKGFKHNRGFASRGHS